MTKVTAMLICIRPFTKAREIPIQYQEDRKKSVLPLKMEKWMTK